MADKLTMKNVTMDKLNGKFIEFKRLSGSGDVYYNRSNGYHHVFKIDNDQAFDYKMDDKGNLVQDKKPVVKLDKGAKVVYYIAKRDNNNPYVLHDEVRSSKVIGEPAVSFVSALKDYLQSLQFFSYDSYLATEVDLLDDVVDTTTTTAATTTTTTKVTTTTTTSRK